METFDFSEALLEQAKTITLAELLDSPLSQCWAVSMMCNAAGSIDWHEPGALNDSDRLLHYRLRDLINHVPHQERKQLYKQCSEIITKRRDHRDQRNFVYQQQQEQKTAS